jgi:hypothetical protein
MTTDTPRVLHIAFRDNGGLATVPMFVQPGMGEEWVRKAELDRLREALAFYADKDGDGYDVAVTNYGLSTDVGPIIRDAGEIARAVLTEGDPT